MWLKKKLACTTNIHNQLFTIVKDVKLHLIQTLNELFCGELGFIQIIHETNPDKGTLRPINDLQTDNVNYSTTANYDHPKFGGGIAQATDIQNGDLCEADQTIILDEDVEEEEGAVGGILDSSQSLDSTTLNHQVTCEDVDLTYELPCHTEGLDQIPTRLPTKTKSRSVTPNKDQTHDDMD